MTFLPLSVKGGRGKRKKKEKSDLISKILLDMLDFPIKRKGFQSGRSAGAQQWKGLGALPPRGSRIRQYQAQFHQHARTVRGATAGWGAKTPSPPPPVGLKVPQARRSPHPISQGRCFSFLHYLTTSFP